jgi:hypothetical protein
MTNTATEMEFKVLRALLTNNFGDDCWAGKFAPLAWKWSDCINDAQEPSGIKGAALAGVCSSLAKKGWVEATHDGENNLICLTLDGWNVATA